MERNAEVEKELIRQVAMCVHDRNFIIAALHQMNTDERRSALIDYIKTNGKVNKSQIEEKMFEIVTGESNNGKG